jgi:hypothetical protein
MAGPMGPHPQANLEKPPVGAGPGTDHSRELPGYEDSNMAGQPHLGIDVRLSKEDQDHPPSGPGYLEPGASHGTLAPGVKPGSTLASRKGRS